MARAWAGGRPDRESRREEREPSAERRVSCAAARGHPRGAWFSSPPGPAVGGGDKPTTSSLNSAAAARASASAAAPAASATRATDLSMNAATVDHSWPTAAAWSGRPHCCMTSAKAEERAALREA